MLDYLLKASPIIIALAIYFFRLERRIGAIITDIDWIKTFIITNTNPNGTKHSPGPKGDLSAQG